MTIDLKEPKVLLLVGPTAVGKTMLSLEIAKNLNGEIISADSRQIFKYMDIGTAKPTPTELSRVPHHFINIRTPDQNYSAGEFGHEARACIREIAQKGRTPIVVGGSGFYIQALVDGLFAPKISDPAVKQYWHDKISKEGIDAVFATLSKVDPESAARLHRNDHQRVVRALEVWQLTGQPISSFQNGQQKAADFVPIFIGLNRDRHTLYKRIEARVDAMLQSGLIEEVERLRGMGYDEKLNALRTVGYIEVFEYLRGEATLPHMTEKIKKNTRRYAKRQLTWFRRDARIRWIDLDSAETGRLVETICSHFSSGDV